MIRGTISHTIKSMRKIADVSR